METVSDILGKGFKFEQRTEIEVLPPSKIEGTVPLFIGGAHWGAVNTPTFVTKSFSKYFGTAVVSIDDTDDRALDFSGLAAEEHLKNSQYCYFTRISDGTDKAASRRLKIDPKQASFIGNSAIKNTSVTVYPDGDLQNNKFSIDGQLITIPSSVGAEISVSIANFIASDNLNKSIIFSIDGTLVTYRITGSETISNLETVLRTAITNAFGFTGTEANAYLNILVVADIDIEANGTVIKVGSSFYKSNGTIWGSALSITEVTSLPAVNPTVGQKYFLHGASNPVRIFNGTTFDDTALTGSGVAADRASVIPSPVSGDYYYATDTTTLSYYTTVWTDLVAGTDYINSAVPTIIDDGAYYYNTTSKALYVYSSNSFLLVTFTDRTALIFTSQNYGKNAIIEISNFPGTIYNENNIIKAIGVDTSVNAIITQLNSDITSPVTVGFDSFGRFMVVSNATGAASTFTLNAIENSIYDDFRIILDQVNGVDVDTTRIGSDEIIGGVIEALYTGEEGNTIKLFKSQDVNGYKLTITIGSNTIGSFYNYSLNVADDTFIGTMINTDRVSSQYVKMITNEGAVTIPDFELGQVLSLSGGTSGLNGLEDFMYVAALSDYENMDLYDIDMVCTSGIVGENVVEAIQNLCETRMDCFGIIDPPQSLSPYLMERWHNGLGRATKLDSEFLSLYYPWVMVTTTSTKMPNQWVAPSVKVVGAISSCDIINQHKFAPPAGYKNTQLSDVQALEIYLKDGDKQAIYSDTLDNNINPIVYTKRNGYFIDGQKTTKRGRTPLNRIKTVRTALYIKRRMSEIAADYFWRGITPKTKSDLFADISSLGTFLASKQAIKEDFEPVVDSINDKYTEADNGLIGMLIWSPIKSVEKIKIISVIRDKQISTTIQF